MIKNKMKRVTIIIPTKNEEKHIGNCLKSIYAQDYPRKLLQVIVIDNDSTDKTLEIAKDLGAEAVPTKLLNEEIKRSYAIKKLAKGEIIGMVDADNYLPPQKKWLKNMIKPFDDPEIAATDTMRYAYRPEDNLITRYCALIGGDDAVAVYLGLNDHYCYMNNTLVGVADLIEDRGKYYRVVLNKKKVPALGMNGFFFRKKIFDKHPMDSFMHPIFVYNMAQDGHRQIAKVKQEIIHVQPSSIRVHFLKKLRRMRRRNSGEMSWNYNYGLTKKDYLLTSLYILSVLPVIADTIVGFIRKPSGAWLFHPLNTYILFFCYVYYVLFTNVRV